MRVGGELGETKGREEVTVEKSKSSSKKNKRRQKKASTASMPSPVQRLFNTCREVFADGGTGTIPSDEDAGRLRSVLDTLRPVNVGLSPRMSYFRNTNSSGRPKVTYFRLYNCLNFEICIFCLPPGAVIPLHNHPGMTVFGKLLFGSMHIKSYDWVKGPEGSTDKIRASNGACLAKVVTDAAFTAPCDTSILYPESGGNLHRFTARTACAVLDILGPPYDDPERPCTFYNDYPFLQFQGQTSPTQQNGENYYWLEERESMPGYPIFREPYTGPRIVDN